MMTEVRVFYATKKGANEHDSEELRARIQVTLLAHLPGKAVTVVGALTDYDERFAHFGTWEGWQLDVATGVRFNDRLPRYHMIIVTDREIGRVTAAILQHALEIRKPVLFFEVDGGTIHHVRGVSTVDSDDWKGGWRVYT